MKLLEKVRSVDEGLVAIAENDACCCDAIQVLTGCTFGKGNFFYVDYGKMAFSFASRSTGKGVRLVLKDEIFSIPEQEQRLSRKIAGGGALKSEVQTYEKLYEARGEELFARGAEAFFKVEVLIDFIMPEKAPRAPSRACSVCAEMVMETKLKPSGARLICRG